MVFEGRTRRDGMVDRVRSRMRVRAVAPNDSRAGLPTPTKAPACTRRADPANCCGMAAPARLALALLLTTACANESNPNTVWAQPTGTMPGPPVGEQGPVVDAPTSESILPAVVPIDPKYVEVARKLTA